VTFKRAGVSRFSWASAIPIVEVTGRVGILQFITQKRNSLNSLARRRSRPPQFSKRTFVAVLHLWSQILSLRTPTPCWLTPSALRFSARYLQLLHAFPDDSFLPFCSRRVGVDALVSPLRPLFA